MTDSDDRPASAGKGRPTPKRPRRGGPVAPPPLTRREAAKRVRAQSKEARTSRKGSPKPGEPPRYLLKRDQGPVRALVRDIVDSRRHVGVLLLPAALLPLLGQATGSQSVVALATSLWLATLLAAVADFVTTAFAVRKRIRSDFPEDTDRGHLFYATMRTAQFRRLRIPKPRVTVGDKV